MAQLILFVSAFTFLYLPTLLGYNLVFGKGKILHFGHGALGLVASYGLWTIFVQFHVPFLLSALFAFCIVTAAALLLAWLSLRLEPDGLGVMSIALHLAVLAVVLNWQSVTRGALGIPQIPRPDFMGDLPSFTLVVGIVGTLWAVGIWLLNRSSFGRALEALAEHPWHAGALGISRRRIHSIAFVIAGLGAFVSSIFFPMYLRLLSPSDYGFSAMIFYVLVVVAGGPGRVWSVVTAAFFLTFLREGIRFVRLPADMIGPAQLILFGLILFAAVWWRRKSIFPPQREV